MVSIRFRLEAVADVEQAKAWHESQRPGLGTDFFRSLEDVVDLIARHPDGFPEFAPGLRRALMNRFPYAVYYQHAEGRRPSWRASTTGGHRVAGGLGGSRTDAPPASITPDPRIPARTSGSTGSCQ